MDLPPPPPSAYLGVADEAPVERAYQARGSGEIRGYRELRSVRNHEVPDLVTIETKDPPQAFMNNFNLPLPATTENLPSLFRESDLTLQNNLRFHSDNSPVFLVLFRHLVFRFLKTPAFGAILDLNSPGRYYFKVLLVGIRMKQNFGTGGLPEEVIDGFQLPLETITVRIPGTRFTEPQFYFTLTQWLNSLGSFYFSRLQEASEAMTQRGAVNTYTSFMAIKTIRLMVVRGPSDMDFRIGCGGNLSTGKALLHYSYRGEKLLTHSVQTGFNNNCLFFALCFEEFKRSFSSPSANFNSFLSKRKGDFLFKTLDPVDLKAMTPDEINYFTVDLDDRVLLRKAILFFKTHLVIFLAASGGNGLRERSGKAINVELFYDSRSDPEVYDKVPVENNYFSFVADQLTEPVKKQDVQGSAARLHVYPILNDATSVYHQHKGFCEGCGVTYFKDPWNSKRSGHTCNAKKISFQEKNKVTQLIPYIPEWLEQDESNNVRLIDKDNMLQKTRVAFPFTNSRAIPEPKSKFANCPYTKKKHVIFYDFETLFSPEKLNEAEVYAVGFYTWWDDKYHAYFGETAMDDFLIFLLQKITFGCKLVAYNGAKFDALLIARASLDQRFIKLCEIHSFMVNAGELLSFCLSPKDQPKIVHRPFDLYKFTLTSLAKACKSAGCKFQKSIFPHDFITGWDKLNYYGQIPEEKYFPADCRDEVKKIREEGGEKAIWNLKKECLDYLHLDVMAMVELFHKEEATLKKIVSEHCGVQEFHLLGFFSISHFSNELANEFWRQQGIVIFPPHNVESYDLFKSGYLGGKVDYGCRFWESTAYAKIKAEPERAAEIYKETEDYMTYQDVTSLYPSIMLSYFFPMGAAIWLKKEAVDFVSTEFQKELFHPVTQRVEEPYSGIRYKILTALDRFFRNPDVEGPLAESKESFNMADIAKGEPLITSFICSYWEVTFQPPKDLRAPVHMYKSKGGKLQTDLYENRQWLYFPDVFSLLENGYRIIKVHHILTWSGFARHLRKTMLAAKSIKDKGSEIKDEVMRSKGKTLLNALYGKFGQQPNDKTFEICHNLTQFFKFITENVWMESTSCFDREKKHMVTMVYGVRRGSFIFSTKPTYLAGFVTAYSRLQNRRSVVDPILRKNPTSYLIGYHDTDSFCIRREDFDAIDPKWVIKNGETELFGQIKDDLASSSKQYGTLKTQEPVKIIRLMVIAKKVYFCEYLLPDGTVESTAACKGISQEVDKEIYEKVLKTPRVIGKEFITPFSMTKSFFSTTTLKRKAELEIAERKRKWKKNILEEYGNTVEALDRIAEEENDFIENTRLPAPEEIADEANTLFMIQKVVNSSRSFNKTPPDYRFIDLNTGRALPWGHVEITEEKEAEFKELFGVVYKPQQAIRFSYRNIPEISLSLINLEKLAEAGNPEQETPDEEIDPEVLAESLSFGFSDDYFQ